MSKSLEELLQEKIKTHTMVDEFVDYGNRYKKCGPQPNDDYARWVLNHFRLPATLKIAFDPFMKEHKLFCTYENVRFRVVGASRMGDIWLSLAHEQDHGYDHRVYVDQVSDWGKEA